MNTRPTSAVVLALLAPLASAAAQDPIEALDQRKLLVDACAKMAQLPGVAFKTLEAQDNAMMRQLRGRMPGGFGEDIEVKGKWCNGVTQAQINFDEDEVILHGSRALARSDGAWKLRRDTLVSGQPMPFVLDPQLFFEVVRRAPADQLTIRTSEKAKYRGEELTILATTFTDDSAEDLSLAGVFPQPAAGGGLVMRGMGGMGGMFGGGGQDEVIVDMAFYVDPESKLIHRVRIKCYKESAMAGQIQIAVGGAGGGDEEEEEEELQERDEQGKRIYKKGLPVRNLGGKLSLADFDVSFSEHGKTFTVELDDQNRELLGLPR